METSDTVEQKQISFFKKNTSEALAWYKGCWKEKPVFISVLSTLVFFIGIFGGPFTIHKFLFPDQENYCATLISELSDDAPSDKWVRLRKKCGSSAMKTLIAGTSSFNHKSAASDRAREIKNLENKGQLSPSLKSELLYQKALHQSFFNRELSLNTAISAVDIDKDHFEAIDLIAKLNSLISNDIAEALTIYEKYSPSKPIPVERIQMRRTMIEEFLDNKNPENISQIAAELNSVLFNLSVEGRSVEEQFESYLIALQNINLGDESLTERLKSVAPNCSVLEHPTIEGLCEFTQFELSFAELETKDFFDISRDFENNTRDSFSQLYRAIDLFEESGAVFLKIEAINRLIKIIDKASLTAPNKPQIKSQMLAWYQVMVGEARQTEDKKLLAEILREGVRFYSDYNYAVTFRQANEYLSESDGIYSDLNDQDNLSLNQLYRKRYLDKITKELSPEEANKKLSDFEIRYKEAFNDGQADESQKSELLFEALNNDYDEYIWKALYYFLSKEAIIEDRMAAFYIKMWIVRASHANIYHNNGIPQKVGTPPLDELRKKTLKFHNLLMKQIESEANSDVTEEGSMVLNELQWVTQMDGWLTYITYDQSMDKDGNTYRNIFNETLLKINNDSPELAISELVDMEYLASSMMYKKFIYDVIFGLFLWAEQDIENYEAIKADSSLFEFLQNIDKLLTHRNYLESNSSQVDHRLLERAMMFFLHIDKNDIAIKYGSELLKAIDQGFVRDLAENPHDIHQLYTKTAQVLAMACQPREAYTAVTRLEENWYEHLSQNHNVANLIERIEGTVEEAIMRANELERCN